MAAPWEKYANGGAPRPSGMPQVIEGPPREPPPQTATAAAMDAQQLVNARLEEEAKQLALVKARREAAGGPEAGKATVDERTSAFLATRLVGSVGDIARATRSNPEADKPSVGGMVAGVFGGEARNYANSPERRRVESAQMDVLDAALTLGTGAAYTREQLEGYRESYFPRLTDDPATIADKNLRLRRLIEAAKVKAGTAAPMIDQALALLDTPQPTGPRLDDAAFSAGLRKLIQAGDTAGIARFAQEQGRKLDEKQLAAALQFGDATVSRDPSPVSPALRGFGMGVGDVVEGAGDVLGIVGNPLNATINAAFGTELSTDLGQTLRDATGLPEPSTGQQKLVSAINKGGVGGLSLAGGARAAAPLANGVVQSALSRFGAAPLTDAVAGSSGGASSELARQQGAGPVGQFLAGVAGGAAALPVTGGINALASRVGRPTPAPNALMQAADAEGININRAMADESLQPRVTGVDATVAGSPIIRSKMGGVANAIETRVRGLGHGGEPLDEIVGGQTVERAGRRYIETSGKQARREYDAAEKAAAGATITPTTSLQVVDDAIARLSETANTNAKEIGFLQGLKGDLSKDLSVGALRDLRTSLRQKVSKGELAFGQNEARVLSILDSAADDIAIGLEAQGKGEAARLFKRADANYRERMDFISGTVQKLIGKRNANLSPQRVFSNLQAMAAPKGDAAGLGRMLKVMDPEERADIAATFAEALGRDGKGEFSTAFLVSQAKRLPRAAQINLFGKEGVESLDNLKLLSKAHSRVMRGLNASKTGVANDWRSWMNTVVFGGGTTGVSALAGAGGLQSALTGAAAAAGVAGAKGARDVLSARALMNSDVAKWLARTPPTSSVGAMRRHADRLSAIAVRNPALSSEIASLQQLIGRAMNDNYRTAAASGQEKEDRPERQ